MIDQRIKIRALKEMYSDPSDETRGDYERVLALVEAVEAAKRLAVEIDLGLTPGTIAVLDHALARFDFGERP